MATGTVGSGATTITLTTDGVTAIGNGQHTLRHKLRRDHKPPHGILNWSASNGPGTTFGIPAAQ